MAGRAASTGGAITIDRTSPVPLYFQLAQRFESAIRSCAFTTAVPRPSAIAH